MTAKMTLEEIEAEIAKLGDQRWYGKAHTLRLLEICREQRETIRRLQQYTCEACADADSCDRVGRSANRQCVAFRVGTKK